MEPSESDSAALSDCKEPQLGSSDGEPSSPGVLPPPSDLNHVTEEDAVAEELQNKLDLKGYDEGAAESEEKASDFDDGAENEEKVSDFVDGVENEEKVSDLDDGGGGRVCDGEAGRGWETNSWNESVNEDVGGGRDGDGYAYGGGDEYGYGDGMENNEENNIGGSGTHCFPLRPEAEDCSFYMRTGNCKFGSNCKFNHPIRRKTQAIKEKVGEREELADRPGQTECKYYQRSGGCKYGKACKYDHTRVSAAPISELNFLGLPIRLGERECPYYMRTGSCKFGANCKFNHPDPTTVGGCDPQSRYGHGGSISVQGASQPSVASWSSPRAVNETSYMPMMMPSTQGATRSEWNGYQAPIYPSSNYVTNNLSIDTNVYMHHQKKMPAEEFPERPGEPECSYFLKTGDCKFKSNCKFHHPKNRLARLPPCNLSDKGLPLRPDQTVCSHYSRYGICKFGPACKFDHPIDALPLMMPGLGQQPYTNLASVEVAGMGGSAGASHTTIQQSV